MAAQWIVPILVSGDVAVFDNDIAALIGEDVVDKYLLSGIQFAVDAEQDGTLDGVAAVQDVLLGGLNTVELEGSSLSVFWL